MLIPMSPRERSRSPLRDPDGLTFQVQVVHAASGTEVCSLEARSWWTAKSLKASIAEASGIPQRQQRLLVTDDTLLEDSHALNNIDHEGEALIVSLVCLDPDYVGWKRFESRSRPGIFYYFCPAEGTRVEPPEPWEKVYTRHDQLVSYYYNRETRETSLEKPEM
mmetsp:Transcript_91131/g.162224  ORF Transcript_91131/g.162224 Transcript_91131/m.162224 type:complete len:164 (+) Transcript_91131:27-518(+)